MEYIIIAILVTVVAGLLYRNSELNGIRKTSIKDKVDNGKLKDELKELHKSLIDLQDELGSEREKNRTLLSQKKSSETRLGQISEHLIPFLNGCTHDPKNLHFMGNPIDYLAFDFDDGKITFLEVKSGNSKASKRQKIIKNIIKTGRVFYEELRINEKGIKSRVTGLDGQE
jgi:predicted Holliday junction resolvase-like endonuclease